MLETTARARSLRRPSGVRITASQPPRSGERESIELEVQSTPPPLRTRVTKASAMVSKLDAALDNISAKRADFGAKQNRLEATVRNNANVIENQSAARSRVMDTDFAKETANLTRTQILQQAGTAMLAQANQLPANVLSLLG